MLSDLATRPIHVGNRPAKLFLGKGSLGLEVVEVGLGEGKQPSKTDLRALFRGRQKRRAAPVVIVVPWGDDRAGVCGPIEHNLVELEDVSMAAVEAVCRKALAADGRHAAIRLLRGRLSQLASKVPGLRNGGLFAMQELERGLPRRGDWASARAKAEGLRALRMRALMRGLGHEIDELPGQGMVLLSGARRTAVAVFVERLGKLDSASEGSGGVSPISYALAQADRSNLDWVVAGADSAIRLYPAKPGVGTGRRGRAETFVELDLELLSADRIGCLWLFFSKDALIPGGSVEQILKASEDYAVDLGGRLRERVYREAMPMLARQVAAAMRLEKSSGFGAEGLVLAYQASLRILFRILFVAYAEDRGLLPLRTSRSYREHSLKRIAQRLEEARRKGVAFGEQDSLWTEVDQIWKAVSSGHPEWGVPAYNGELFARDASVSELGARIAMVRLSDRGFAPVLSALLLDETPEGTRGPVDFRSLGVREFGTIYEGLLESELSIADTDLKVGASGAYLPAKKGDEVAARAGQTYLHNRSGARKSTGSYYTPAFAVDHLLDRALEPAIKAHLDRLDEMSDREAGRRFFEFRVADIAMGSGHFLVGAVDRIERGLSNYLSKRPLPDVREEFGRLRKTAEERLGLDRAEGVIEDVQLLRRQVARRCVFGVDINSTAVDLARLSLWIHTFVPGLPLSLLDENLVQGNSLVGIASLDEASELFRAGSGELFSQVARDRLDQLAGPLERLGRLAEATNAEVKEARELHDETRRSVKGVADLFTLLSASRTNAEIRTAIAEGRLALSPKGDPVDERQLCAAREEFAGLDVLHFPLLFPQVLCFGERRGFDVILGNPPWEKVKVEEHGFWARHFPGLRSLPQRVQERDKERYRAERPDLVARLTAETRATDSYRRVLSSSGFPGMGTGDPDLHKAFSWRFLELTARVGGKIGVVLPRTAMSAKGSAAFRKMLLKSARTLDVTMLTNRKLWAFPRIHPQYTACLAVADVSWHRCLFHGNFPWNRHPKEDRRRIEGGSKEDRRRIEGGSKEDRRRIEEDRRRIEGGSKEDRRRIEGGSKEDRRRIEGGSKGSPTQRTVRQLGRFYERDEADAHGVLGKRGPRVDRHGIASALAVGRIGGGLRAA